MGHFVRGTKRVDLGVSQVNGKGEWVELKTKPTQGDIEAFYDAMLKFGTDGKSSDQAHIFGALGALRSRIVVGWKLYDDDGSEVPFDRALVLELDPDDSIVEKIDDAVTEIVRPFFEKAAAKRQASRTVPAGDSTGELPSTTH